MGHLEGTGKALHTISSYRSDLKSFERFLEMGMGPRRVALHQLTIQDLTAYQKHLSALGLRTNTRRRKILTVRKLLKYLSIRKKINLDTSGKMPAPFKVERIPETVPLEVLMARIRVMPTTTLHQARNRVLLLTLAETGCLVSEVTRLKYESFSTHEVRFEGKAPRALLISRELSDAVTALQSFAGGTPWLFLGFNRFGPLGQPITPRGVELLIRHHAESLGFEKLTPRTFRHSAVLHWHRQGAQTEEIQKRLGLKSTYAFRVYSALFKSSC